METQKISEVIGGMNLPSITAPTKCDCEGPQVTLEEKVIRPGDPGYMKILGYQCAREICPDYQWTPEIRQLMNVLVGYFFNLDIPHVDDLSPRKGIALIGTYGTGKTMAFRIVHRMLERRFADDPKMNINTFRETSIEDIVTAMKADDFNDGVLFKRMETTEAGGRVARPLNILINEFGVEYTGKHYGTPISELLDVFLMKRYEIFQQTGQVTHATMNYSAAELSKKFTPRLVDRFREMFNFVPVSGKSFRK